MPGAKLVPALQRTKRGSHDSPPTIYGETIHDQFPAYIANWPPNQAVHLGTVGVVEDYTFHATDSLAVFSSPRLAATSSAQWSSGTPPRLRHYLPELLDLIQIGQFGRRVARPEQNLVIGSVASLVRRNEATPSRASGLVP